MVNGSLHPESSKYEDLIKANGGIETPAMIEAKRKLEVKEKTDKINKNMAVISGNKKEYVSTSSQVTTDVVTTRGFDYATEFQKDIIDNPKLIKENEDLNAVTLRIDELEDAKSKTYKELVKAHP